MYRSTNRTGWAVAAALAAALLGCSRGPSPERSGEAPDSGAPQAVAADSAAPRTAAPVVPAPPAQPAARAEEDSALVGDWHLEPVSPMRRGPGGIQLTLTVDSARSERLWGRLSRYMAGNRGADPAGFRPFVGALSGGAVAITIERIDAAGPAIGLAGPISRDTVHLTTFWLGPDTLSRSADWVLVRER